MAGVQGRLTRSESGKGRWLQQGQWPLANWVKFYPHHVSFLEGVLNVGWVEVVLRNSCPFLLLKEGIPHFSGSISKKAFAAPTGHFLDSLRSSYLKQRKDEAFVASAWRR